MEDKLLEMNFLRLSRSVAHIELNRYRVDSQRPLLAYSGPCSACRSASCQKRKLLNTICIINGSSSAS